MKMSTPWYTFWNLCQTISIYHGGGGGGDKFFEISLKITAALYSNVFPSSEWTKIDACLEASQKLIAQNECVEDDKCNIAILEIKQKRRAMYRYIRIYIIYF